MLFHALWMHYYNSFTVAYFKAQSDYEYGGDEKHHRNLHQDSWSPGKI